jgi:ABC-type amino acid transport substrate-binding protein
VDVARAVANRLQLPVELINADGGSGLDGLPAGAFDAMLAGLAFDAALAGQVDFSAPYFDAGPALLVRASAPLPEHPRVLLEVGSPWWERVEELVGDATIAWTWDVEEAEQRVLAGEADALLLDRPTALERVRQRAAGELAIYDAPREPERDGYRVALRRANRPLSFAVQEAVDELRRDGTLAHFELRWFGALSGA